MKKKIIIVLLMIIVIAISMSCYIINKKEKEEMKLKKAQERYAEIRENVKKAVKWNIGAQFPNCEISKEFKETSTGTFYNSKFLINNGYIKKEELLDVDNESYCDVFVDIKSEFENPLDNQNNCKIYYKIYLKCKDYKDKGYEDWGR